VSWGKSRTGGRNNEVKSSIDKSIETNEVFTGSRVADVEGSDGLQSSIGIIPVIEGRNVTNLNEGINITVGHLCGNDGDGGGLTGTKVEVVVFPLGTSDGDAGLRGIENDLLDS
jgi:hypothetical protein